MNPYAAVVLIVGLAVIAAVALALVIDRYIERPQPPTNLDRDVLVLDPWDLDLLTGTEAFMRGAGQWLAVTPQWQDEDTREAHAALLREEFADAMAADYDDDLAAYIAALLELIADAWGSVLGTIGPHAARGAATEVVRAALDRIGPDGPHVTLDDGTIGYPDGWRPPQIEAVLRAHGWRP